MQKVIYGVCGTGGFAREVMPLVRQQVMQAGQEAQSSAFFVDVNPGSDLVNSHTVISEGMFHGMPCDVRYFNIAIADSKIRQRIAEDYLLKGAKPFSIRAPSATVYDCNEIGEGAILCANSTVTSNARIGRFFQCNIYSYVAHDCVIGDFVTFAPAVHCNGNIHVGDHAYIGTGAVIKPGSNSKPLRIGQGAIVGMGAVVTRDVEPFTTVIGNPARVLERN